MVKLDKNQAIYVYSYLATVSLLGLLKDYIVAKYALHNGSIEKLDK